jgi:hypothetical protein
MRRTLRKFHVLVCLMGLMGLCLMGQAGCTTPTHCGEGTVELKTDGGQFCVAASGDDGGQGEGGVDAQPGDASGSDGPLGSGGTGGTGGDGGGGTGGTGGTGGSSPDAAMHDAAMPDAAMPDAAMPDAAMPDAFRPPPDATIPDAASPDASGSCTNVDPEPNGSEAQAVTLPSIDDCDSSGSSVSGTIVGASDVDFFRYAGSDTPFCIVDPGAAVDAPGLRICEFALCPRGIADTVAICNAGVPASSPAGYPGCCEATPGQVGMIADCVSTSDDSAEIYLRVDQPGGSLCMPYSIVYHF